MKSLFALFIAFILFAACGITHSKNSNVPNTLSNVATANSPLNQDEQIAIFNTKQKYLASQPSSDSLANLTEKAALSFAQSSYKAGTLDEAYPEKFRADLHQFDCLTLLETSIAMARCIKAGACQYAKFVQEIKSLRYRTGEEISYASRLHYFSEWLVQAFNQHKIVWLNGPDVFKKEIYLMSHANKRPKELASIKATEAKLSQFSFRGYSCDSLHKILEKDPSNAPFQNGDIVAFASNVPGLDFNHVGFVHKAQNRWTFVNATSVGNKQVEVYSGDLAEYCSRVKTNSGAVFARLE